MTSGGGAKDNKPHAVTVWQISCAADCVPKSRLDTETGKTHLDKLRQIDCFRRRAVIDVFKHSERRGSRRYHRRTVAPSTPSSTVCCLKKSFTTGDHSLRRYAESCALSVHSVATHAAGLGDSVAWRKPDARQRGARMAALNARRVGFANHASTVTVGRRGNSTVPEYHLGARTSIRGDEFYERRGKSKTRRRRGFDARAGMRSCSRRRRTRRRTIVADDGNALVLDPPIHEFVAYGGGVEALRDVERFYAKNRRAAGESETPSAAPQHVNLVGRRAVNNSLAPSSPMPSSPTPTRDRRTTPPPPRRNAANPNNARVALGVAGDTQGA